MPELYHLLSLVNDWGDLILGAGVVVVAFCKPVRKWIVKQFIEPDRRQNADIDLLKRANLAILHDKIYTKCRAHIGEGSIDADEMKNLEHLFEVYEALGGNGTAKKLYEKCTNLPIRSE